MKEDVSFKEKLKTIHFGIVPGGFRDTQSSTMFDREDETLKLFPGRDEVEDIRSDFRKNWPDKD